MKKSSEKSSKTKMVKCAPAKVSEQNAEVGNLYAQVRVILDGARNRAARSVNFEMVRAYWQIGEAIVEHEQAGKERADYGARLIEELSARLKVDGVKGFSKNNLWYMRQFYLAFPEKLHALRGELSWTHYRLLLKVEKPAARAWYEEEAATQNWENPAIGILLCADKNEAVVRYTLPEGQDQILRISLSIATPQRRRTGR